jgi:hypothetical protein
MKKRATSTRARVAAAQASARREYERFMEHRAGWGVKATWRLV